MNHRCLAKILKIEAFENPLHSLALIETRRSGLLQNVMTPPSISKTGSFRPVQILESPFNPPPPPIRSRNNNPPMASFNCLSNGRSHRHCGCGDFGNEGLSIKPTDVHFAALGSSAMSCFDLKSLNFLDRNKPQLLPKPSYDCSSTLKASSL